MNTAILEASTELWGHHQLICTSGLDGDAPWLGGLVAGQMGGGKPGIRVQLPEVLDLYFPAGHVENVRFAGDAFSLTVNGEEIIGAMPDASHLFIEGLCTVGATVEGLRVLCEDNRMLIGVAAQFRPELLNDTDPVAILGKGLMALDRVSVPAGLDVEGKSAYRKAVMLMRSQVYQPEGVIRHRWTTPERWPHRDMWLWDSVFHALGWRHLDPAMARDAISAVFDCQRDDGFIPHRMTPEGEASQFTQPPLLAYGVELILESEPAPEWLRELYPKLQAYLEWDFANRDTDGAGLLEWHIEEHEDCRSGESGADNSPRFDPAKPLDAVDFNAYIANDCACMARLSHLAGFPEDASMWENRGQEVNARIREVLWDEENGFFFDFDPEAKDFHRVWSSSGFMPLFCGAASAEQAERLVAQLNDGAPFDTSLPVASVAPCDVTYKKDMWRGPSWLNHSWMIAEGLDRYGYAQEAQRIRDFWLKVISRDHHLFGTFFEYYDCEDDESPVLLYRKGVQGDAFPHQTIHFYGWTGTLYVDLCHRFRS